jgi:two-component system, response regulator PdtaR
MIQPIKILIVEDEAITAMYLQMRLKKMSYDVIKPVGSGENAIQAAKAENPNVILMDISLSGKLDGIQTALEISRFCEAHFIFMSGYNDDDIREQTKSIKTSSYLMKPITVEAVSSIIDLHFKQLS